MNHKKIKKTLSSIFTRKGRDGQYTRLFDNLEPEQKESLLKNVQLSLEEQPIIGSFESHHQWLLVTTERIFWSSGDETNTISLEAIRDVVADLDKLARSGHKKDDMKELEILSMNGEHFTVEVEAGPPLMGTWNALKNLGAQNRRKTIFGDSELNCKNSNS